jgi:glutathione S-transferase
MKLYIAKATCSRAVQLVVNELGLTPELIHYDIKSRATSSGEDFRSVNPLGYVPVLRTEDGTPAFLTETTVIISYLADRYSDNGLIPAPGTIARVTHDQLLAFTATEIALRHAPLMRKLTTAEGTRWAHDKLLAAYSTLNDRLADRRRFLMGDTLTVADAYVWATMWHSRSGVEIEHLKDLGDYIARVDCLPSAKKTLVDESLLAAKHTAELSAD